MHPELAAGLQQPVDGQQPQYFFPTDRLASRWQLFPPKLRQAQLPPQLARQPAIAEGPWSPQLHSAETDLDAVGRVHRQLTVGREQTQIAVGLLLLVEHLQGLAPRRLLRIVDLP